MTQATEWVIITKRGTGSWTFFPSLVCDQITLNSGARPSTAKIKLNNSQWNNMGGLQRGDWIRIFNPVGEEKNWTILFEGLLTAWTPNFAGGNDQNAGDETSAWFAQCPKFAMGKRWTIYGQFCYARSAYTNTQVAWASGPPVPSDTTKVFYATGRRCVFNENIRGKAYPNKDANTYSWTTANSIVWTSNIFSYLSNAGWWSVRDMIKYVLNVYATPVSDSGFGPNHAPADSIGLSHADFDVVKGNVVVEKLNPMEAIEYLAALVGWKYRLDWYYNTVTSTVDYLHVFYKPGTATASMRTDSDPVISHRLYSPTSADSLPTLLEANINLIQAANMIFDSANVVNYSVALGERTTHEITSELVPAWQDADLTVWSVDEDDKLFYSDAEIKELSKEGTDPNTLTFFTKFHTNGSTYATYKNVGRKWALNETGTYCATAYSRGDPFDPTGKISGLSADTVGYMPRNISECLAKDAEGNRVRYFLEFSVDGGTTWHDLHDFRVELLENEWGILITEPNLSEIDLTKLTPEGTNNEYDDESIGYTDEQPINFWTSVVRDKEAARVFLSGQWKTRVRLTACIQLDTRLIDNNTITDSGSLIQQAGVFDYANAYFHRIQQTNSRFYGSSHYSVDSKDDTTAMTLKQSVIDAVNKMCSFAGSYEFPWIYVNELGMTMCRPRFMLGDTITAIDGRGVSLQIGDSLYPFIEQIIYQPELCQMAIITADLRTSRIG